MNPSRNTKNIRDVINLRDAEINKCTAGAAVTLQLLRATTGATTTGVASTGAAATGAADI
jgi:hypothetical protein